MPTFRQIDSPTSAIDTASVTFPAVLPGRRLHRPMFCVRESRRLPLLPPIVPRISRSLRCMSTMSVGIVASHARSSSVSPTFRHAATQRRRKHLTVRTRGCSFDLVLALSHVLDPNPVAYPHTKSMLRFVSSNRTLTVRITEREQSCNLHPLTNN